MTGEVARERHVELLLGSRVYDSDGRSVGRIEEFHAEKEGDHYAVVAIDLGPVALLERLAVRRFGVSLWRRAHGYRARWDQIDLENECRPTLTCGLSELEVIRPSKSSPRHRRR